MYEDFVKGKLMIGKREYDVLDGELPQYLLNFYVDNPRVYSALRVSSDSITPTQDEIQKKMCDMDHVKQLRVSIESNGGLIDPVIVRAGDMVVLEGNSRLAAYRILANKGDKWTKIRCRILPAIIDDSAIFTLLGQYHIIGRKDWSPFEQAGYLYRRHKDTKYPASIMAKELGITECIAKNYIRVYEYMIKQNDLVASQWSYYEELLKNRSILNAIEKTPKLEETLVEQIKNGELETARDIRKVGEIAKASSKKSKKVLNQIATGEKTVNEAYDEIKESGDLDEILLKLKKFRDYISEESFEKNILNGNNSEIKFLLKKVSNRLAEIEKKI
jgi:hypothetical protein